MTFLLLKLASIPFSFVHFFTKIWGREPASSMSSCLFATQCPKIPRKFYYEFLGVRSCNSALVFKISLSGMKSLQSTFALLTIGAECISWVIGNCRKPSVVSKQWWLHFQTKNCWQMLIWSSVNASMFIFTRCSINFSWCGNVGLQMPKIT